MNIAFLYLHGGNIVLAFLIEYLQRFSSSNELYSVFVRVTAV